VLGHDALLGTRSQALAGVSIEDILERILLKLDLFPSSPPMQIPSFSWVPRFE